MYILRISQMRNYEKNEFCTKKITGYFMKKILIIFMILTTTICYAQEQQSQQEVTEINLDTGLPAKTYKLNKPNYNNNIKTKNDDEDDMPINFMASPLQILKQYQQNDF